MKLTPNSVPPGGSFVASGRGQRKTLTALFVGTAATAQVSFRTGGAGTYNRTLTAPSAAGTHDVIAKQKGADGAWRQIDHADPQLRVVAAQEPAPTPEPTPEPEPTPQPTPEPTPTPPPPTGTLIAPTAFQSTITNAVPGKAYTLAGPYDIPGATFLHASGVQLLGATPRPVIRPAGRPNGLFIKGSSTVVRGMDFAGFNPGKAEYNDSSGSALLEILGNDAPVRDTLIEDIGLDMPIIAGTRQHAVYLSYDIERLIMRNIRANGHASQGGMSDGLTAYHDATPATPLRDIVLEDWTFTDFFNAVVFWLPCSSLTFRRCKSVGTRNVDIQLRTAGPVYFEGSDFAKPIIVEGGSTLVDRGGNRGAGLLAALAA